jgi:putative salt-induced outer membrane protein YdiY
LLTLDTGEKVIGELLPASTSETVILRSALLGELQLPRARVLSIQPAALATSRTATADASPPASAGPPPVSPAPTEAQVAQAEERKIVQTLKEFKAPDHWSGNLRFGVNLSQGDRRWTETYARGQLEIKPTQSLNFYRFNGSYTYRQTERADGSQFKSTDKYDAQFIYRRSFREHWFVQNSLGARVDQIKGIDREVQEAIGIGYNYKPSETFEILFGGGGGVEDLQTDYMDTRTGLNPLANLFQEATWRPLQRTTFVQKFNYYWNPEDSDQFNYVFSAAVRVRLTELLGLEFSYNKSFDNDVGDGNAQDDTQWRNALVVYF